MNNEDKETLAHVGIMGMKWGHRKGSGWESKQTSTKNSSAKKHVSKVGSTLVKSIIKANKIDDAQKRADARTQPRLFKINGNKTSSKITNIGPKKVKPENSTDYINSQLIKKKSMNTLTNAQLKTFNERVQLEKTYKQLNPSKTSKGQKIVEDLLINATKQVASVYIAKYMGKGGAQLEKLLMKTAATTS